MTSKKYVEKIAADVKKSMSYAIDELIDYQRIWSNSRFNRYMSLSEFIDAMESIRK